MEYSDDLVINAIHQGIKRDIDVCLTNECGRAGIIHIYSAIDTMAFLGMPADQVEVRGYDFIQWADRYIRFPCAEQVSGLEFYGARCGMLHTYGTESSLSRTGKVRQIGYINNNHVDVRADPAIDPGTVIVSVCGLRRCLFAGIDRFLIDVFQDSDRAAVAELRLAKLVNAVPRIAPNDSGAIHA